MERNKYLEKVAYSAAHSASNLGEAFAKSWRKSPVTSKIGLGMSAAGLGLSVASYNNSVGNRSDNQQRNQMEQKSISLLEDISKGLKRTPKVVVKVDPSSNLIKKALELRKQSGN